MFEFLNSVNPLKKEDVYLRCKSCGHKELMNKEFVAKVAGIAVTAFGCKAWIGFLFAGTGFAFVICAAIVAGGVAMLAYADDIVLWFAERYECPECKARRWELIAHSTLLKEKEMNAVNQKNEELITLNKKYAAEISTLRKSLNESIRLRELGRTNEVLNVEKLKENFWDALRTCKKELDIYVPFIGCIVEDKEFVEMVAFALRRGVKIKIRCGMENNSGQNSHSKGSAVHIHGAMDRLKRKLSGTGITGAANLTYRLDNAHCKLLIVDNEYYILSSMNFLSYRGEDIIDREGKVISRRWEELGEKSYCKENLSYYRETFFDF